MTILRYNNLSVILHWVVAAMLFLALFMGVTSLEAMSNSDPEKIGALQGHMIVGLVITALMIVRLIVKLNSSNPPHMTTGSGVQNKLGAAAHNILYLLVIVMGVSGMGIAILTGIPDVIQGIAGAALPETFDGLVPRSVHGAAAKLLILLIALHVLASAYHQLFLKDNIMARMKFGQRFKD